MIQRIKNTWLMTRRTTFATAILGLVISVGLPATRAESAEVETLVPGYGYNGIHGITFDAEDRIYVGSVIGMSIHRVDPETGASEVYVGPQKGMADDLEFGPDGSLVWTSFIMGTIHAQMPGGEIRELATGLPGINSLAFDEGGRLFATQVFLGDALYEIDPAGVEAPRLILEGMGGLNGFDVGPDGKIYGPLWFKGQIARIDVDTGELTVVAEGFDTPAAVNFDSKGNLWALDTARGEIVHLDAETGERIKTIAFRPAMDNLAFDSNDRMFVTIMAKSGIYEIDTESGEARTVKESAFSAPADIDLVHTDAGDLIYMAGGFSVHEINAATGEVRDLPESYSGGLKSPIGISANEKHLLVSSWFSDTIRMIDRVSGEELFVSHDFSRPMDAIELPGGDWIVLEGGTSSLLRVSGEDKSERTVLADRLIGAVAIAWDGASSVYITRAIGGRVIKADLDGAEATEVVRGLKGPEGIAIAPDGRLIVSEVLKKRIIAIDPKTGQIEVIAEDLPIGLRAPFGLPPAYMPSGVAVDAAGTIYLTSDLESSLLKITP